MKTINKVILLGKVMNTPTYAVSKNGQSVVFFRVDTWHKKDDNKVFQKHECVGFGRTAEIIRDHVKENQKILIEGCINYTSKNNQGIALAKIIVHEITILSYIQTDIPTNPNRQKAPCIDIPDSDEDLYNSIY